MQIYIKFPIWELIDKFFLVVELTVVDKAITFISPIPFQTLNPCITRDSRPINPETLRKHLQTIIL